MSAWALIILGAILIILGYALPTPLTIERLLYGFGCLLLVVGLVILVLPLAGVGGPAVAAMVPLLM